MKTNRTNQMTVAGSGWTSLRPAMTSLAAACLTVMLATGVASPVLAQAPAAAPAASADAPAVLTEESRKLATLLIKNTLVGVNQANLTGNYTVLRDLATPGFRQLNSSADLGVIFANLRKSKVDLSPIVLMDPVITAAKFSKEQKQLRLKGYFPSEPMQVQFELIFQQANPAGWVLHGVSIGTAKVGAASNQDPADTDDGAAAAQPRTSVRPASTTRPAPATTPSGVRPKTPTTSRP